MQRLLSLKLASNLPKNHTNSTTTATKGQFFQHYKTFTLTKPPQTQTQTQNNLFSSFPTHPWRSGCTGLAHKGHNFWLCSSNILCRSSSKRPSKHIFESNPKFTSNQSFWRSWFRKLSGSDVVFGLVVVNVAVFVLWRVLDKSFMTKNFTISLYHTRRGRLHTLVTSAFSHVEPGQLVCNMIELLLFGMSIGRVFGPEFLLKLYLAGAVGGSMFFLVHKVFLAALKKGQKPGDVHPSLIPGLGASGAVSAIMLLDIFLFPRKTLYFDLIIPVPAILAGIFLIAKDMLRIIQGDKHVSGATHLGGAAAAAIAYTRIRKGRF